MIISYFTTSKILDFFLINFELYVWSIFFGLILGSLYVLIKRTNKTNVKKLLILFVGLCFGLLLSFSEPMMENRALAFVFFRLLFILLYLADLSSARTVAWIGSKACVFLIFFSAF